MYPFILQADCAHSEERDHDAVIGSLFRKISVAVSGIEFKNHIRERLECFENFSCAYNGGETFIAHISSVNDIAIDDFNSDGNLDMIIAGNLYTSEIKTPRNDDGFGAFLASDDRGNFTVDYPYERGVSLGGDIRELC
jgi:hypothetical protein